MSYTLCIPARPKTGTTSLWYSYSFHPEISASKQKEPLQEYKNEEVKNYIQNIFKVTEKTKVLLDGSVNVFFINPDILDVVRELKEIKRVCVLYIFRDPLERLVSEIYTIIYDHIVKNKKKPFFINSDNKIDTNLLEQYVIGSYSDARLIETISNKINPKDIFFLRFENLFSDKQKILSFLEIDKNVHIKEVEMNKKSDRKPTIEYLKMIKDVVTWFEKNKKWIKDRSEKEKEMILKRYFGVIL